jgi:hypothetical protein
VREAVVPRAARATGARLVAYVVPATDRARGREGAAGAPARAFLPDFMVPAAFVAIDAVPLTANGKVDRRALPEPAAAAPAAGPAAHATEEAVAAIWREVLGVDEVARTTTSSRWAGTRCAPRRCSRASRSASA